MKYYKRFQPLDLDISAYCPYRSLGVAIIDRAVRDILRPTEELETAIRVANHRKARLERVIKIRAQCKESNLSLAKFCQTYKHDFEKLRIDFNWFWHSKATKQVLGEPCDALEWINSECTEPFTFAWLCQQIFNDPQGIKKKIRIYVEKKLTEKKNGSNLHPGNSV